MDRAPQKSWTTLHTWTAHDGNVRLLEPRRTVVRSLWLAIVVPAYALLVVNIPAYFASLHRLASPAASAFTGQLTLNDVHMLASVGLSLNFYAICMLGANLLFQFSYAAAGVALFWRKSDDRMALLVSFGLMLNPFGFAYLTLQALPPGWLWLIPTLSSLGNASLILCGYIFPDGRFIPSWTRWLSGCMIGFWLSFICFPNWEFRFPVPYLFLLSGFTSATIVIQIFRYRFVSTARQRQQTKWVVFAIVIAAAGNIGTRLLYHFVLLSVFSGSPLASATEAILIMVWMLVIPPMLAIAILSSHLWEIDVIINRALVYGTLTTLLALVYAGMTITLQYLLNGIIKQTNAIAIVGSTLAIVALFNPLRQRIQNGIDRRFYRRKYDAARTLAAFSETLRQEVDLEQLKEQLIAVVEETMQPTSVSLWLSTPEHSKEKDERIFIENRVLPTEVPDSR